MLAYGMSQASSCDLFLVSAFPSLRCQGHPGNNSTLCDFGHIMSQLIMSSMLFQSILSDRGFQRPIGVDKRLRLWSVKR